MSFAMPDFERHCLTSRNPDPNSATSRRHGRGDRRQHRIFVWWRISKRIASSFDEKRFTAVIASGRNGEIFGGPADRPQGFLIK